MALIYIYTVLFPCYFSSCILSACKNTMWPGCVEGCTSFISVSTVTILCSYSSEIAAFLRMFLWSAWLNFTIKKRPQAWNFFWRWLSDFSFFDFHFLISSHFLKPCLIHVAVISKKWQLIRRASFVFAPHCVAEALYLKGNGKKKQHFCALEGICDPLARFNKAQKTLIRN